MPSELMARYDIAVLELAEPVKGIEPLPVAERDPKPGAPAKIVGHGRTRFFGLDPEDTPARFRSHRRPLVEGRQTILSLHDVTPTSFRNEGGTARTRDAAPVTV